MLSLKGDTIIGQALLLYGEFAEAENQLMAHFLRPGDWALDIGANIGTVTLPMAKRVGSQGRVVALDPQRLIFQTLCANIAINGMTNVIALPLAVASAGGSLAIPALDPLSANNFGAVAIGENTAVPTEKAMAITVDSLDLPACRLIKIDVEGMEPAVLQGAAATIARHRPVIYFEAKKGGNTCSCISFLQERNYCLWWHFATFFNMPNFKENAQNVFGNTGDINAVAVPAEWGVALNLPRIRQMDADWQQDYQEWMNQQKPG